MDGGHFYPSNSLVFLEWWRKVYSDALQRTVVLEQHLLQGTSPSLALELELHGSPTGEGICKASLGQGGECAGHPCVHCLG